jgi:hypothetical protein
MTVAPNVGQLCFTLNSGTTTESPSSAIEQKHVDGKKLWWVFDMNDNRPTCDVDNCADKATRNYQKTWVQYSTLKNGGYSKRVFRGCEIEEPTGEDNRHYCEKHGDAFERGEI